MTTENKTLNITEIQALLPHRYPFLMIDRVTNYDEGKTLTAIKNVSVNEPQFTGHFQEYPIMPGVLMLEALAQTAGIYGYTKILTEEERPLKFMYFATINNVKFKSQVVPGDVLTLEVTVDRFNGTLLKVNAKATVEGNIACSADLGLWLVDRSKMNWN